MRRGPVFWFCLIWVSPCSASIPARANWDVSPGNGSNTNGGFFVPGTAGTVDYSHGLVPHASGNDLSSPNANVNAGARVTTAGSYSFTASDVNNGIYITGGSCTTGWYLLTAFVSNNQIMVDRPISTSASVSGCTYAEGGSLNDPGVALTQAVQGNIIHLQAPTSGYTVNCATVNNAGCIMSTQVTGLSLIAYAAQHFDFGAQFVINVAPGVGSNTILTLRNFPFAANITINCNNLSGTAGSNMGVGTFYNVWIENCPAAQSSITSSVSGPLQLGNYVTGATSGTAALQTSYCIGCEAIHNTISGIGMAQGQLNFLVLSISALNTGVGSHGVVGIGNAYTQVASVMAENGGDGLHGAGAGNGGFYVLDSILEGNAGAAFSISNSGPQFGITVFNSSWYGNGSVGNTCMSGHTNNCYFQPPPQQTNSAFLNGPGGDFSLNLSPTGGLLLRESGYPTQFLDGINTTYLDRGPIWHRPVLRYRAQNEDQRNWLGVLGVLALAAGFVVTRRSL
jgi:hypothetical protein